MSEPQPADASATPEKVRLQLERILAGRGTFEDLDTLLDLAEAMTGKTICVLSDSCATPVVSGIKKFRSEFEGLITGKRSNQVAVTV